MGNLVDWGVYLVDAMNWSLGAAQKTPRLTSASAPYVSSVKWDGRVS